MTAALELSDIHKRYGETDANRGASLCADAGEIVAVVGENGAGKSTLMKIAYGLVTADRGQIFIRGESIPIAAHSPDRAISLGVGMVHQHFMLMDPMTVVENAVLGREPTRGLFVDLGRAARELVELSETLGLGIDPWAKVGTLSVGQKQRVEILKVLWQGAQIIILDEPTAVLTPGEVRQLFSVLGNLAAGGKTLVLITHKLDEITTIAHRAVVLRRGQTVAEMQKHELSPTAIAHAMVGRPIALEIDKPACVRGETVLAIDDLEVAGRGAEPVLAIDHLEVAAGEIVGIAGVEGNGQRELCEAICGLIRPRQGIITLAGDDITALSTRARFAAGIAHVPEDRHHRGLILERSIADNLLLGRQDEHSTRLGLDREKIAATCRRAIADFDIRPPEASAPAAALSGGNQQKIVIARELLRPAPKLLVCAQPTRGVDIGAILRIHEAIVAARGRGLGVILVSAELSELLALADRVEVLYKGRISGSMDAAALARDDAADRLGEMMTGAGARGAA